MNEAELVDVTDPPVWAEQVYNEKTCSTSHSLTSDAAKSTGKSLGSEGQNPTTRKGKMGVASRSSDPGDRPRSLNLFKLQILLSVITNDIACFVLSL